MSWTIETKLSEQPYHISWGPIVEPEFEKEYFKELQKFITQEIDVNNDIQRIFPEPDKLYNALQLCKFNNVRVILIAQDPYINYSGKIKCPEAMGLSFSVPKGVKIPPSLRNIYKELDDDPEIKFTIPINGDLSSWAEQGVLLLNTTLTVREKKSNSHYLGKNKGWERFTDSIIKTVSTNKENCVFLLWGRNAQAKKKLIDTSKHIVLESVHPSPLSASRGFFGNRHFSKCNKYLEDNGLEPIDWNIE